MLYNSRIGFSKGRQRFFKAEELEEAWEEFKNFCDNNHETVHEFSQRNGEFISSDLRKKITYTVLGFCNYLKLSRTTFYEYYRDNPEFKDVIERIQDECEIDARRKFETGVIPHQIAPLWMSNYGYSTKTDTNIKGSIPIVIENDLNN